MTKCNYMVENIMKSVLLFFLNTQSCLYYIQRLYDSNESMWWKTIWNCFLITNPCPYIHTCLVIVQAVYKKFIQWSDRQLEKLYMYHICNGCLISKAKFWQQNLFNNTWSCITIDLQVSGKEYYCHQHAFAIMSLSETCHLLVNQPCTATRCQQKYTND